MAARKTSRESTPAPARGATQTIEELEARAEEVRATEEYALHALSGVMREIAAHCPPEGRLGLRLAQSAKTMELWGSGRHPETGAAFAFRDLCDHLVHDWPDRMEQDD